ncbi:FtsW/RodA/SpoVE family cell cycle protein [Algisphaera agarilytica]|uniref:Probable peptidoglycan glycosyltransferase FtsW n=1 Tax=Algisphaera agarilytica TaxID=1385975 RepID=A0A7X0H6W3_9BACT|nr:putative peptidoglycan glycosyltransferase FtsW [Algisphaera agarilytica]MBB6430339.1 cell division protein FtsW [Algisphaera agarilytica]
MPRPTHILLTCVLALLGIGVVMVHSAGVSVASADIDANTYDPSITASGVLAPLLSKNLVYAVMAVGAMLLGSRVDLQGIFSSRGWWNPVWFAVIISLILCGMTLMPGVGKSVNGASRWLVIGPAGSGISFQPSELMKWTLVVGLAWYCARRRGVMHRFWWGLMPGLLLVGLACGLIVIEDLGTAALIGAVAMCVLIAGGARLWQLALMLPFAVGAIVAAIIHSPYRVKRLTAFMDPWADSQGTGYHPIQSMLAFAQGGVEGNGLGQSIQKYYIPEDTTDFVFPIIAEELGFGGAVLVVGLFLTILWVGLGIAKDTPHTFGRLVALGVLLTVGLQAVINIAVVTVVVPTKGIALPLISAGGTGWIFTAFAIGLVASLDNAKALREVEEGEEEAPPTDVANWATPSSPTA